MLQLFSTPEERTPDKKYCPIGVHLLYSVEYSTSIACLNEFFRLIENVSDHAWSLENLGAFVLTKYYYK